jgi:hypothetical protein
MSESSRPAPGSRVELEPVTCWPLILAAVSFVTLGLLAVGGLAAWSALFPPVKPAVAQVATTPETPAPARTLSSEKRVDLPPPPVAARQDERIVKRHREVVRQYHPLPAVRQPAAASGAERPHVAPSRPTQEVVPSFKKLRVRTESELLRQLWEGSVEVSIVTKKEDRKKLVEEAKNAASSRLTKFIEELIEKRSDLRGLPLQDEKSCRLSTEHAITLRQVSAETRRAQGLLARLLESGRARPSDREPSPDLGVTGVAEMCKCLNGLSERYGKRKSLARPLEQMYQTETLPVREVLIGKLAEIKGKEATEALARRAVFDLASHVRDAAVKALQERSRDEARPIFLAALEHPWAPAAEHAAWALAALKDHKAADSIAALLKKPDPCAPFREGKKWYVREVARVNHLSNCLLCHPPSQDSKDLVVAPIPVPGEPLPVVYYSGVRKGIDAVRAEVVYFRQDFSAMHAVAKPDRWPGVQRFDYLVRKREVTDGEAGKLLDSLKDKLAFPTSPRYRALCYARDALRAGKIDAAKKSP